MKPCFKRFVCFVLFRGFGFKTETTKPHEETRTDGHLETELVAHYLLTAQTAFDQTVRLLRWQKDRVVVFFAKSRYIDRDAMNIRERE